MKNDNRMKTHTITSHFMSQQILLQRRVSSCSSYVLEMTLRRTRRGKIFMVVGCW
jgi:hypothetical protein